jgi:CheY-like chemotaxis protein
MISHEIRTPMQAVYGILELIGEETTEQRVLDLLQTAKTSASGLLEILDDVLDLAKMDAAKFDLDDFEVPVRMLARGVNEALAIKIMNKPVALKEEVDSDVPFVIRGDPKRLRQILMNLVGNAVKFTAKGSVTIRISAQTETIDRTKHPIALRWEVADTGIGIPDAVREKLFEPFVQADGGTQRKYGGTGLGLSICRKLVELMGGTLGVNSTEGVGSIFWFEIPVESVSTEMSLDTLPRLDDLSILVIEDHPLGAKEIVKTLTSVGAHVERGATLAEGLAAIKSRPFHIVMSDQGLPDGEGLSLLKEVARTRPATGLIMYTARDDYGLQYTLRMLGATYIAKPASRRGLVETIATASKAGSFHNPMESRKVLVAEDTESVRDILKRQFEILQADVTLVENGVQAMEAMRKDRFGLVLSDLHMPEMDGYALAEHVRAGETELDPRQPLVVMTADVQLAQPNVFRAHGFDECVLKPASLGQMRRLFVRWGIIEEDQRGIKEDIAARNVANAAAQTPSIELGVGIDLEGLKRQMGAIDESAVEMMEMFVEMTENIIVGLESEWRKKERGKVLDLAHSLKGSARSAACERLGDVAARIQDAANSKEDLGEMIQAAKAEFARVGAEVKLLRQQVKG